MAVEVHPSRRLLPAMTRAMFMAVLVLCSAACSGSTTPTSPTPETIPLPAGAPADAAAPAGMTRVTFTAVEILDAAGVRVAPDALRVNGALGGYRMRVWVFCPRGLEGPTGDGITREIIDFVITKRDLTLGVGGTFSGMLELDPGYNTIEDRLSMANPGRQLVRIEIRRNFAVVAVSEFVATFN
jgi:hypothetical protein